MPADDERREVARRLRDCVKNKAEGELLSLNGSSAAIRWLISSGVFGDKKYHSGVDLLDRLAELIEPSCDRDTLLELADICESTGNVYEVLCSESGDGAFYDLFRKTSEFNQKVAIVIRNALGVVA